MTRNKGQKLASSDAYSSVTQPNGGGRGFRGILGMSTVISTDVNMREMVRLEVKAATDLGSIGEG